jgi:hypothetical protein
VEQLVTLRILVDPFHRILLSHHGPINIQLKYDLVRICILQGRVPR